MNINAPTVSVVIPTYNRQHLVDRAIQSVCRQTLSNWECIVVDDCSEDTTARVVDSIADGRIRLVRHTQNLGASAARNTGINEAKGDYVAFLDADDEWLPRKLEEQVALFEQSTQRIGIVYSGVQRHLNDGRLVYVRPKFRGQMLGRLLEGNYVGTTSAVTVRRQCVLEVGGFDPRLPSCQDWDLWIRLAKHWEFDFVPKPLVIYHEDASDRISDDRSRVVEGRSLVEEKFKSELESMSRRERALVHTTRGWGMFMSGATRRARATLFRSVLLSPGSPRVLIYAVATLLPRPWVLRMVRLRTSMKAVHG